MGSKLCWVVTQNCLWSYNGKNFYLGLVWRTRNICPRVLDTHCVMLTGKQSYKLIRTDLTLQGHALNFCVAEDANIAQYIFPFLQKRANF